MVCERCKIAVQHILEENGLHPKKVDLGEIILIENNLDTPAIERLKTALEEIGFELIDKKNGRIIEGIKQVVIQAIHYSKSETTKNFSDIIAETLHYDYSYLSKLFSEIEGITIEHFIMLQKIERVKELIVYDELSLTQIADELQYSSVAHLSNQFKKVTGMTATAFKGQRNKNRKGLDSVIGAQNNDKLSK